MYQSQQNDQVLKIQPSLDLDRINAALNYQEINTEKQSIPKYQASDIPKNLAGSLAYVPGFTNDLNLAEKLSMDSEPLDRYKEQYKGYETGYEKEDIQPNYIKDYDKLFIKNQSDTSTPIRKSVNKEEVSSTNIRPITILKNESNNVDQYVLSDKNIINQNAISSIPIQTTTSTIPSDWKKLVNQISLPMNQNIEPPQISYIPYGQLPQNLEEILEIKNTISGPQNTISTPEKKIQSNIPEGLKYVTDKQGPIGQYFTNNFESQFKISNLDNQQLNVEQLVANIKLDQIEAALSSQPREKLGLNPVSQDQQSSNIINGSGSKIIYGNTPINQNGSHIISNDQYISLDKNTIVDTIKSTQLSSQNNLSGVYKMDLTSNKEQRDKAAIITSIPASNILPIQIGGITTEFTRSSASHQSQPRTPVGQSSSERNSNNVYTGEIPNRPTYGITSMIEQNLKFMENKRCEVHDNKMEYICSNNECIRKLECFLCLECYANHVKEHRVFPYHDSFSFEIDNNLQEMKNKLSNAKQNLSNMLLNTRNQIEETFQDLEQEIFLTLLNIKERCTKSIQNKYDIDKLKQMSEDLYNTRTEIFKKPQQDITPFDIQRYVTLTTSIFSYLSSVSTEFHSLVRVQEEKNKQGYTILKEEINKLRTLFKNFETFQSPFESDHPVEISRLQTTILSEQPLGVSPVRNVPAPPTEKVLSLSQGAPVRPKSLNLMSKTIDTPKTRGGVNEQVFNLASQVATQLTGSQPLKEMEIRSVENPIEINQNKISQSILLEPKMIKHHDTFLKAVNEQNLSRMDIQLWDDPDDTAIELFESLRMCNTLRQLVMILPSNLSNLGYYLILGAISDLSNLEFLKLTLQFSEGRTGLSHLDHRDKVMKILASTLPSLTRLQTLELNITNIEGKVSESGIQMIIDAIKTLPSLTRLEFGLSISPFAIISQVSNKIGQYLGRAISGMPNLIDLEINLSLKNAVSLICFKFMSELLNHPLNLRKLRINFLDTMNHGTTNEEFIQFSESLLRAGPLQEFGLQLKSMRSDITEQGVLILVESLKNLPLKKIELALYRGEFSILSEQAKSIIKQTFAENTIILCQYYF